jgi:hypothetical protein
MTVSGVQQAGVVEIFKRNDNNGMYQFHQRLASPLPTTLSYFGNSISTSENRIIVSDIVANSYSFYINGLFFVVDKTYSHSTASTARFNKNDSTEAWISNIQVVIPPSVQMFFFF